MGVEAKTTPAVQEQEWSVMCDKGVAGPPVTIHYGSAEKINRTLDEGLDALMPELIQSMQKALAEGQIRGYGGVVLLPPKSQNT